MEDRMVTISVEIPASSVDQIRHFCQLVAQFPRDAKACAGQMAAILAGDDPTSEDGADLGKLLELLVERSEITAQLILCLHSVFKHATISDPDGRKGETLQ